jgi:hypothetical protein
MRMLTRVVMFGFDWLASARPWTYLTCVLFIGLATPCVLLQMTR